MDSLGDLFASGVATSTEDYTTTEQPEEEYWPSATSTSTVATITNGSFKLLELLNRTDIEVGKNATSYTTWTVALQFIKDARLVSGAVHLIALAMVVGASIYIARRKTRRPKADDTNDTGRYARLGQTQTVPANYTRIFRPRMPIPRSKGGFFKRDSNATYVSPNSSQETVADQPVATVEIHSEPVVSGTASSGHNLSAVDAARALGQGRAAVADHGYVRASAVVVPVSHEASSITQDGSILETHL